MLATLRNLSRSSMSDYTCNHDAFVSVPLKGPCLNVMTLKIRVKRYGHQSTFLADKTLEFCLCITSTAKFLTIQQFSSITCRRRGVKINGTK